MNSCVEFSELISAYIDGELSDFDRRRVDEHLDACESCSALIELYKEISISVNESCSPAPDSLLTGVMEKITSHDNSSMPVISPKRKSARIIMLRYIPVAACLAIMLLALPWVMDTLRRSTSFLMPMTAESSESRSSDTVERPAVMGKADMDDAILNNEDIDGGVASGSSAPDASEPNDLFFAPEASPQIPDLQLDTTTAPIQRDDGRNSKARDDSGEYSNDDDADAPYFEPPPIPNPTLPPIILIEPNEAPELMSGFEANTPLPPDFPNDAMDDEAEVDTQSEEGSNLPDILDDAYAIITITGKLPKLLETYDPMPAESWSGWEMYYVIPRAEVKDLAKYAESRSDVSIKYNNAEGSYAVVLISPDN